MIDGYALGHGVDLEALRLDRFCNFMWWFITRNAESEQAVEKLRARLWMPPAGEVPAGGPWSAGAETAAFKALQASVGG